MKEVYIRGVSGRGSQVIKVLEDLGCVNKFDYDGERSGGVYIFSYDGHIKWCADACIGTALGEYTEVFLPQETEVKIIAMDEIKQLKIDAVINLLDLIVLKQYKVNVSFRKGLIGTYDDNSGQRGAYLSFGGFYESEGIKITEIPPENKFYYVRRRLAFVNKGDEGKEDAILLRICPEDIKECKVIEIKEYAIILDDLAICYNRP